MNWMRIVAVVGVVAAAGVAEAQEVGGTVPIGHPQFTMTQPATQAGTQAASQAASMPTAGALVGSDKLAVTSGSVVIGGKALEYTATTGYMPLKDEGGKLRANIFYVAYTVPVSGGAVSGQLSVVSGGGATTTTAPAGSGRPVMFLFNGGPGSSAVWLHLGTAGPRRLEIAADGAVPRAPYRVVENEFSWLGAADLVFIDPVTTGYSRAATPEQGKEFHGVQEDVASVGEFVRLYLTKNMRWGSPVFLAGESYGTTRAAGLAEHLQAREGVSVSGVILISSVLNFAALAASDGNDLPYLVYLPSYTAAALYHGKIKGDRAALLKEAEALAVGEYAVALAKGASLPDGEREKMAEKLAGLTGLSKGYVLESDLRVPPQRFLKELLRGEGKVAGRFDARITGAVTDPANDAAEWDPSFDGFLMAYSSAFNDYVRRTLKYENDLPYDVLTGKVMPWNYGSGGGGGWGGYLYVGDNLRNAMTRNPEMKVLVAAGMYDFATPYFSADYQVNHLHLAKELRKNITQTYYPGGHMLYHERAGLEQLQKDVGGLVERALRK